MFGQIINDPNVDKSSSPFFSGVFTLTFANVPNSGNMLFVSFTGNDIQTPPGWAVAVTSQNTNQLRDSAVYYKLSNGTETGVQLQSVGGGDTYGVFYEVEGPFDVVPIDDIDAIDYTGGAGGTLTMPFNGVTTTVNDNFIFLFAGHNSGGPNANSIDNGFTIDLDNHGGNSNMGVFAHKVLTATGTETPTVTWGGLTLQGHGHLVAFRGVAVPDIIPPVFTSDPVITNTTSTGHTISATLDETAVLYGVRLAAGSIAPNSTQVMNGQDSTGAAALEADSDSAAAGVNIDLTFSTGSNSTEYDYYFASDDVSGNLQTSAFKVVGTTTSASPVIVSVSNSNASDTVTIDMDNLFDLTTVASVVATYKGVTLADIVIVDLDTFTATMPSDGIQLGSTNNFIVTVTQVATPINSEPFAAIINPPTGTQVITLLDFNALHPDSNLNRAEYADILSPDQWVVDLITTVGGYTIVQTANGMLQYNGGGDFTDQTTSHYILDASTAYSKGTTGTITLDAPGLPTIQQQPANGTVIAGDINSVKTFTVVSNDAISYQWQLSDNAGVNWSNVSGATNTTLDVVGNIFQDNSLSGRLYRCIVTNAIGSTNSNSAILTINEAAIPVITLHPVPGSVQANNSASNYTFIVEAINATSYQWESSEGIGASWINVAGAVNPSLLVSGSEFLVELQGGRNYRCKVSNASGTIISNIALLTVTPVVQSAPVITSQPSNGQVQAQNNASSHGFNVVAIDGETYLWQSSDNNGSNWDNILGGTSSTLIILGSDFTDDALTGRLYRVNVANGVGAVVSESATLVITAASSGALQFIISSANPVVTGSGTLVTYVYPLWELWDKIPDDPTAIIIDSGSNFTVTAGVGSVPTPSAQAGISYIFIARNPGDTPARYIRTKGQVL